MDEEPFDLNNNTLLRGYLSHLQALARKQAALHFEFAEHPKSTAKRVSSLYSRSEANGIQEAWELLREQLMTVLGPGAALKPYGQLAAPGSFSSEKQHLGRDPFRITMKALKLKADKARRKHPKMTLLQSWNIEEKKPKDNYT
jgi:hypothetical protein